MALQEDSKAQAPVYLLYLYSKWQSIDLYQSIVKDLIMESILQSPSNQLKIVFGFLSYFGLLWRTVNYLRKDHIERQQQQKKAEEEAIKRQKQREQDEIDRKEVAEELAKEDERKEQEALANANLRLLRESSLKQDVEVMA